MEDVSRQMVLNDGNGPRVVESRAGLKLRSVVLSYPTQELDEEGSPGSQLAAPGAHRTRQVDYRCPDSCCNSIDLISLAKCGSFQLGVAIRAGSRF